MRFAHWLVLVAGSVMGYQLFCDPIVGIANNGDFSRVYSLFHLVPDCDRPELGAGGDCFFKYVVTKYRFGQPQLTIDQVGTEHLLALAAVELSRVVSKDGSLDIRTMGAIHGGLWLLGLWLLAPVLAKMQPWAQWVMAVLLIVVYCDVSYVQYSNSLYMDTPAIACTFLVFVLLVRLASGTGSAYRNACGLMITTLMASLSKTQHALLFLVLLVFLVFFVRQYWPFSKAYLYAFVAAMLLGIGALMSTVPLGHRLVTVYSVVFDGLFSVTQDHNRVLEDLGMPVSWTRYAGSTAYSANSGLASAEFEKDFRLHASQFRLLSFYLRHPGLAVRMVGRGLRDMGLQRIPGFGNFPKSSGLPERTQSSAFSLWSEVKIKAFQQQALNASGYFVVSAVVLFLGVRRRWPQRRDLRFLVLLTLVMAGLALGIATLCDVLETTRHLYMYTFLSDTLFVAACGVWLAPGRKI